MEFICFDCMAEPSLRTLLSDEKDEHTCDICNIRRRAVSIERLCEEISEPIRNSYEHGRYNGLLDDSEGDDLVTILGEELGLDDYSDAEEIAAELCSSDYADISRGDTAFFSDDACYVRSAPASYMQHYNWRDFSRRIKHESRYFGASNSFMEDLFRLPRTFPVSEGLAAPDLFGTGEAQSQDEDLPIRNIPAGSAIGVYRARVAWSIEEASKFIESPHTELSYHPSGPPAGRMNAEGVPVFYCSLSQQTAIKEMRAGVGSIVVVGKFSPQRNLRLLDLTRLGARSANTIFSPAYQERNAKIQFLSEFDRIVSRPVRADHERLEYLPTQVVAEYVDRILGLDGVVYSSAQEDGETGDEHKNIALFRCASWVVAKIEGVHQARAPGCAIYSPEPLGDTEDQDHETLLTIDLHDVSARKISGIDYTTDDVYFPYDDDSDYGD